MEYLKQNKKTILKRQVLPLAAGKGRWKGKIGGGRGEREKIGGSKREGCT